MQEDKRTVTGIIKRAQLTNEGRPWLKNVLVVLQINGRDFFDQYNREASDELNKGELRLHDIKRLSVMKTEFVTEARFKANFMPPVPVIDINGEVLQNATFYLDEPVEITFTPNYHLILPENGDIVGVQKLQLLSIRKLKA